MGNERSMLRQHICMYALLKDTDRAAQAQNHASTPMHACIFLFPTLKPVKHQFSSVPPPVPLITQIMTPGPSEKSELTTA